MSKQISNGTPFNIYYSENNIPYNNTNIKITGAECGIIICKDESSYNLLFVNELGTPYLLSDDVNRFYAQAPIKLENKQNGKEREIKLSYDNSLLLVNSYGQLMVNRSKLNAYYANKSAEEDITKLTSYITSLQEQNSYLKSQIDILNKRFNALNIDKDEYKPAYLDIWLESYQDNLCIIKKDDEDITHNYYLPFSGKTTLKLYSTYSCSEVDKYNWNDTYNFVEQITNYTGANPDITQKNNYACISIKNAYLENKLNEYEYNIDPNNSGKLYLNDFTNTYDGYIGNKDLENQRVSCTYNLKSEKIGINECNEIDLQYFSGYTFAYYPFEYIESTKTFNTYQYYPVSKFSINKIDNFNIYNKYPTSLKIICSYFNDNNALKFAYYEITDYDIKNNKNHLDLDEHINRLSSIQIYPCIYGYYGINSNLKLSSQDNKTNNMIIEDKNVITNQLDRYNYPLNFNNVSYLEFKFSTNAYNNVDATSFSLYLSNLHLSTTYNNTENENTNVFNFSIHKYAYINTTTTTTSSTTTITPTPTPTPSPDNSTTTTSSHNPSIKFKLQLIDDNTNKIISTYVQPNPDFVIKNIIIDIIQCDYNITYNYNNNILRASISNMGFPTHSDGYYYYYIGSMRVNPGVTPTYTPTIAPTHMPTTSTSIPNSTTTTSSTVTPYPDTTTTSSTTTPYPDTTTTSSTTTNTTTTWLS